MSGDYGAYGLYYQWGRKDPIVSIGTIVPSDAIQLRQFEEQGNSIEFTINNPTIVVDDINWNGDNTLWGIKKTIYDPCPYGWRVAEPTVWEGISSDDVSYQYSYMTIPEPYSVPAAYYPLAGRSDWINSYLDWRDVYGLYRTTDSGNVMWVDSNYNNFYLDGSIYVDQRASVRCMKDADFDVKTGDVTNVRGTVAEVSGSVTVNDATVLESVGFIYTDLTYADSITLSHENVVKVELGNKAGDFNTTLTGLKPNTDYRIRAYAKGGYNVRYGNEIYITTTSSGSSEDLGNGGDYEWE
jgi:hypothetical protein